MITRRQHLMVIGAIILIPLFSVASLKKPMRDLYDEVSSLIPYVFHKGKYADPKNNEFIQKRLQGLRRHVGLAKHDRLAKGNMSVKLKLNLLSTHLDGALKTFKEGKSEYSRIMVASTMNMCADCHTEGFNKGHIFSENRKTVEKEIKHPYAIADFLWSTRQYQPAVKIFHSIVNNYSNNKMSRWDVEMALEKLAVYYTKVADSPQLGLKGMNQALSNKNLPDHIRKRIRDWRQGFALLSRKSLAFLETASGSKVLSGVRKLVGFKKDQPYLNSYADELFIPRLKGAALLSQLMDRETNKDILSEALHLQGILYGTMDRSLFFSLDESYFRLCIETLPKSLQAQSCFHSLEKSVTLKSSGSSGVHIYPEDKAMLASYRRIAF